MEATTLSKKKNTINKGKLKKNIKNVICRPDQVFWPEINEDQKKRIEIALKKYSVEIPEYKKPHWKELKAIPKEQRPRPPKIKKVDGLLFGISDCRNAIQNGQCSAILIEATVNPRMIVQPIIELSNSKGLTLLCVPDLRKFTLTSFGIKTSCLGVQNECLLDVRNEIIDIAKSYPRPKSNKIINTVEDIMNVEEVEEMKTDTKIMDVIESVYLYRTNKTSRVFVPITENNVQNTTKKFKGQDFIEFSDQVTQDNSKTFMKMILKKISNNPDRVKKK